MREHMFSKSICVSFLAIILILSSTMVIAQQYTNISNELAQISRDTFFFGFETGDIPYGWYNVDYDGDSFSWDIIEPPEFPPHSGNYSAGSASYINEVGALTPDNWLILPGLVSSSTTELTYWVAAQDPEWSEEHLEVWISTSGIAIENFTDEVDSFTIPYGSSNWTMRSVDLSMYDGETIRIAFRHTDVTDQFWIKIDDIMVSDIIPAEDKLPPITTCELSGDLQGEEYYGEVMVTLSAIDDLSGVNYTLVSIDNGSYVEYQDPFVIADFGSHVIRFYSVDFAGNVENVKQCSFINICPLTIDVRGGLFGARITITNIGSINLTDVNWTIIIEGGLVLIGSESSGNIDEIGAGTSVTIKTNLVLGIGKISIKAEAGCAEVSTDGIIFLFLVLLN